MILKKWLPSFVTLMLAALLVVTQQAWATPLAARMAASVGTSKTTIAYQGYLTDATGNTVNSALGMVFRVYNVENGGTALWSETQPAVQVTDGLFSVLLGSVTPLSSSLISNNSDLWLGITIGSDTELAPREKLASAPYAMMADVPDSSITSAKIVDGQVASADIANDTIAESDISDSYVARNSDMLDGYHYNALPYAATSHAHDDSYYTESESDSRFINVSGDTMSGSLNMGGNAITNASSVQIGTQGTLSAKVDASGAGPHMVFETDDCFTFQNGSGMRLRLCGNAYGIGYEGNTWHYFNDTIVPTQDIQYDLGGAVTRRWRSIYVQNVYSGDIAEDVDLAYHAETGDVVVWREGHLIKSAQPNDRTVFGVAKTTDERPEGVPVTLGIYVIKVTGKVHAGDFLVTSNRPGHAMASNAPAIGTVIAQALEGFDGESGLIRAMIRKL